MTKKGDGKYPPFPFGIKGLPKKICTRKDFLGRGGAAAGGRVSEKGETRRVRRRATTRQGVAALARTATGKACACSILLGSHHAKRVPEKVKNDEEGGR